MNNIKYFIKNNKTIIIVSLGFAISTAISGYSILNKMALDEQIQKLIYDAKVKDEEKSNLINFEKQNIVNSNKIIDLELSLKDSNAKIEAFAKQASSCEKIKKRLSIN